MITVTFNFKGLALIQTYEEVFGEHYAETVTKTFKEYSTIEEIFKNDNFIDAMNGDKIDILTTEYLWKSSNGHMYMANFPEFNEIPPEEDGATIELFLLEDQYLQLYFSVEDYIYPGATFFDGDTEKEIKIFNNFGEITSFLIPDIEIPILKEHVFVYWEDDFGNSYQVGDEYIIKDTTSLETGISFRAFYVPVFDSFNLVANFADKADSITVSTTTPSYYSVYDIVPKDQLPQKKGYKIVGWSFSQEPAGSEEIFKGSERFYIKESTTFFAVWEEISPFKIYRNGTLVSIPAYIYKNNKFQPLSFKFGQREKKE